jgi:hypothetical protein
MNIICLLSVRPCLKTYQFFKSIKLNTQYEVYIVIDDNSYTIPEYDGVVNIVKIDNHECEQNGFKSCVSWLENKACSRDKALYYFTKESIDYKNIWFVEEDVFIPTIHTIENIDKKYGSDHDLLVSAHNIIHEMVDEWCWYKIPHQSKLSLPYANAMICAIRCSKAMLQSIKNHAIAHNNLFMDEALFNTLALHNKLLVLPIPELSTIVWSRNWNRSDIVDTHLYHPIKDINIQYSYRNSQ